MAAFQVTAEGVTPYTHDNTFQVVREAGICKQLIQSRGKGN